MVNQDSEGKEGRDMAEYMSRYFETIPKEIYMFMVEQAGVQLVELNWSFREKRCAATESVNPSIRRTQSDRRWKLSLVMQRRPHFETKRSNCNLKDVSAWEVDFLCLFEGGAIKSLFRHHDEKQKKKSTIISNS